MWSDVFEHEWSRQPGASKAELEQFLGQWNARLNEEEIGEIRAGREKLLASMPALYAHGGRPDPADWSFPEGSLPESYIELLLFSNGGEFQQGERYFQFFGTEDFREMNLAYKLPEYMPGAISFALDGNGNHYMFDMRSAAVNGEYPILMAHSGNLSYEDGVQVATSLPELCRNKQAIEL